MGRILKFINLTKGKYLEYIKSSQNSIVKETDNSIRKWAKHINKMCNLLKRVYGWQIRTWKDVQHCQLLMMQISLCDTLMQNKIPMRYHYTIVKMPKLKIMTTPNADENADKLGTLICFWQGYKMVRPF